MAKTPPLDPTKVRPEDMRAGLISEKETEAMGALYTDFYKWKSYRAGTVRQFQNYSFEEMLIVSRELFWNTMTTDSKDLRALGLDFSIPFARKETMDFLSRITALNIKPRMTGDNLDAVGMKVLNGLYAKWRFHSNDKVEKFWEMLYGLVNGTVCSYVGFDDTVYQRRYLKSYDPETGKFKLETGEETPYNDVTKEIVPIEDMYIPKIYERNFQKQGKCIWKTQMEESDFHAMYDQKYPNAKYVVAGNRIAEDSLYYRLLGGSGTTSYNKVEILNKYDWLTDEHIMGCSGILLNRLGSELDPTIAPMPFDHKMGPFTWGITSPLDEKLAYGLPTPFLVKDPHKILNVGFTMMVEREFRAVDPVILSSDIESPDLIYGQHRVIPVNDVNAYKEFKLQEPSTQYFNMLNSIESNMTAQAQGGDSSAAPSKQPKSSREVMENAEQQQDAMANTMVMYYDLVRQEILLTLKTMFQFYTAGKYEDADKGIYRSLMVPDMPLTLGGTGDLKLRLVDKKQPDVAIMLEAIKESAKNGKQTEIIEIPIKFIQDLEFQITKIEFEPDSSDELELSNWVANVLEPMVNIFVPQGIADPAKVFLRWLEKMGESPADFSSDKVASSLLNTGDYAPPPPQQQVQPGQPQPGTPGATQFPGGPQLMGAQQGQPAQQGNMRQINVGSGKANMSPKMPKPKFGARTNKGLPIRK